MANILHHCIFTFLCNLGPIAFGLHLGWLAPLIETLRDRELSPYGEPLSVEGISWLASLLSISMLISTPVYGFLLSYLSYKRLSLISNCVHILSFSLLLVPNVHFTFAARFLAGFASVGSIVITPLYVNECVSVKYYGFLGGLCSFSVNIGIALVTVVASQIGCTNTNIFCICCVAIYFLGYYWLPEPPIYLIKKNKVAKAKKSLEKLKCKSSENATQAVVTISEELNMTSSETVSFIGVFKDPILRKAMFLAVGLMIAQQATGITSISFFWVEILEAAHVLVPYQMQTIIFAIGQLLGAIVGAILLNFVGRKIILVSTNIVILLSYGVMFWSFFTEHFHSDIPFYALMGFITAYSIGLGTVPYVLLPEILPHAARSNSIAVSGLICGILSFHYAQFFLPMTELIGLKYVLLILIGSSAFSTLYIIAFIFETKGKSSIEIYEKLKR